jgi:hypothetical protein
MKIRFVSVLLVMALCAFTLPAHAQNPWDDPNDGKDHMPYALVVGDVPPGPVIKSRPPGIDFEEEPGLVTVYGMTVHGQARGMHVSLHPVRHNKISALSLYSYKGSSAPPLGSPRSDPPFTFYSSAPGWTFKWRVSYVDNTLDWSGVELNDSLPLETNHTWHIAYFDTGQFHWVGSANDDWGYDTGEWPSAWMSFSNPIGAYTAN